MPPSHRTDAKHQPINTSHNAHKTLTAVLLGGGRRAIAVGAGVAWHDHDHQREEAADQRNQVQEPQPARPAEIMQTLNAELNTDNQERQEQEEAPIRRGSALWWNCRLTQSPGR